MSVGDEVILFNGDGNDYHASISELTKKTVGVQVNNKRPVNNESSVSIHLLQPLCRAEKWIGAYKKRQNWALTKSPHS